MSQSIGIQSLDSAPIQKHLHTGLYKLRLTFGWIALFGIVMGLFSVSWDIQWHSAVGRDRTLTAPHLFILGSITIIGIVALASVLIETIWARRSSSVARSGVSFAGFFSSSLGAYLVGYGALDTAVAFPIDQYWHTLYGIDVSLWAPFHIMAIAGQCLSCLGVADMLASGSRLAMLQGAKRTAYIGYAGAIIAFATLMGSLSLLLMPSVQNVGYINMGSLTFTVYPLMFGMFGTFVLETAIRALSWRMVATSITIVYLFFGLVSYLLVPQLMTLLLNIEQQHFLQNAPKISVVAVEWQYSLIIVAVCLDGLTWFAQRQRWSLRRVSVARLVVVMISISMAALYYPFFLSTAEEYSQRLDSSLLLIVMISLLLGLLGAYVGDWLST